MRRPPGLRARAGRAAAMVLSGPVENTTWQACGSAGHAGVVYDHSYV